MSASENLPRKSFGLHSAVAALYRRQLSDALVPLVDGRRLIAAKLVYLYTSDDATLDVGVLDVARDERTLEALSAAVREEAQLRTLPHGEQHFSFVRKAGKPLASSEADN